LLRRILPHTSSRYSSHLQKIWIKLFSIVPYSVICVKPGVVQRRQRTCSLHMKQLPLKMLRVFTLLRFVMQSLFWDLTHLSTRHHHPTTPTASAGRKVYKYGTFRRGILTFNVQPSPLLTVHQGAYNMYQLFSLSLHSISLGSCHSLRSVEPEDKGGKLLKMEISF